MSIGRKLLIKKKDGKLTFVLGDQELHIIEASSNNRLWKRQVEKENVGLGKIENWYKRFRSIIHATIGKNLHKVGNYVVYEIFRMLFNNHQILLKWTKRKKWIQIENIWRRRVNEENVGHVVNER